LTRADLKETHPAYPHNLNRSPMQRRLLRSILRIFVRLRRDVHVFAGLFVVTSWFVVRGLWQALGWS
jgi:hypothetical protein